MRCAWGGIWIVGVNKDGFISSTLDLNEANRIKPVYRITFHITIQIGTQTTSSESYGIFCGPSPNLSIIITHAKPCKSSLLIVQPTGEAEGLEARIRVLSNAPKLIVIDPLGHTPIRGVDHKPRTSQMIGDNPIGDPAFGHVIRNVSFSPIHKTRDQIAGPIQLCNHSNWVLIQESLRERAADFLPDSPILPIDHVR